MAVLADVEPKTEQKTGEGRLSWPVYLLTLAAVTSSSLSVLSLYQLVALRAEVEGLRSEVCHRRDEGREQIGGQTEKFSNRRSSAEPIHQPGAQYPAPMTRRRRQVTEGQPHVSQPCLQLLANSDRKTFSKEFSEEPHTGIPWQTGLRRGTALEADGDSMRVIEEGYYFVYSQVFYMDSVFAMGHVVIRRKRTVVGNESQYVILFRCIQNMNMNPDYSFNTCFTGGLVKLEVGDHLELLIPRPRANVSLGGDDTFLGAIKLA
ncbi:tumor necrosis factor ligand superfamily member 13B [Xyrichtys novacula]|uniref:Tumor necrosis factor ligand superfamily member 13B n=1 Tax=Xyrichtys novacula TaxID=13765 RepID=A0AAV1H249_XYRNO|nr:tumor necrosis factor ligand superfamily member 13B [Xyrichtys novacula]